MQSSCFSTAMNIWKETAGRKDFLKKQKAKKGRKSTRQRCDKISISLHISTVAKQCRSTTFSTENPFPDISFSKETKVPFPSTGQGLGTTCFPLTPFHHRQGQEGSPRMNPAPLPTIIHSRVKKQPRGIHCSNKCWRQQLHPYLPSKMACSLLGLKEQASWKV